MSPTATKYTVDRVSETAVFDKNGTAKRVIEVTFRVGEHGPFTEHFDKDTYTPATVKAKLTDFAQKIAQTTAY